MAKSFFPNPFLPLIIPSSHLPISVASLHLDEPPNDLKQLKIGSQWGFSQAFSLKMTKVSVGANWTLRSTCIGGGQAQYLVSYVQTA